MTSNQQIEPLLVSPVEAARLLGLSRSFFYECLSAGRIAARPIRFGRKVLFSVEEIRHFVESGCSATHQKETP
jgi:excisionase family DNA binding protein